MLECGIKLLIVWILLSSFTECQFFVLGAVPVDQLDLFKVFLFFIIIFFYKFIYLFIYLFLAVLGLRFCARAFSSCCERGPLFIAVRGPLTVTASLVAEHRLQTRKLSSCGSRA